MIHNWIFFSFLLTQISCSLQPEKHEINNASPCAGNYVLKELTNHRHDKMLEVLRERYGHPLKVYSDSTIVVNAQFKQTEVDIYEFDENFNLIKNIDKRNWRGNSEVTITEWYSDGVKKSYSRLKNDTAFYEERIVRNEFEEVIQIIEVKNRLDTILTTYKYKEPCLVQVSKIEEKKIISYYDVLVNKDFNPLSIKYFNSEGLEIGSSTYEYDSRGNNIYWKSIKNNSIDGETKYKYDSANRITEQIDYLKSEDNYSNHERFRYDENDDVNYHWQVSYGDTLLRTASREKETKTWVSYKNGEKTQEGLIKYSDTNKVLYSTSSNQQDKSEYLYSYNERDYVIKESRKTNGEPTYLKEYKWFYNDEEAYKRETLKDGELYEITYFTRY